MPGTAGVPEVLAVDALTASSLVAKDDETPPF
jgi:hypothetical protein